MATVTKSIGTSSRDYSTITLWEADHDDTGIYGSGDIARGEAYNDSAFDETVTLNGGAVSGLSQIILTAATGQEHDGTAGSGVRIVRTAVGDVLTHSLPSGITGYIDWLEIDMNGNGVANGVIVSSAGDTRYIRNCIVHDVSRNTGSQHGINIGGSGTNTAYVIRCVVYDVVNTATGSQSAAGIISASGATPTRGIYNCVADRIVNNNGTGLCNAISFPDGTNKTLKNTYGGTTSGTTSGSIQDFSVSSYSTTVVASLASTDTSASGTGALTSLTASNQFVSVVDGSEDYHLKSGADLIDEAEDLVTTPSGVNIDINGRDVDAEGDTWDIGAHEFVTASTSLFDFVARNRYRRRS